jgi:hypothetical protein
LKNKKGKTDFFFSQEISACGQSDFYHKEITIITSIAFYNQCIYNGKKNNEKEEENGMKKKRYIFK